MNNNYFIEAKGQIFKLDFVDDGYTPVAFQEYLNYKGVTIMWAAWVNNPSENPFMKFGDIRKFWREEWN